MNPVRPNKNLEKQIQQAIKGMQCPVHSKPASLKMDNENEPVQVEACCVFFKQDIIVIGERIRKDFLYRAEKTRERIEKEKLEREEREKERGR